MGRSFHYDYAEAIRVLGCRYIFDQRVSMARGLCSYQSITTIVVSITVSTSITNVTTTMIIIAATTVINLSYGAYIGVYTGVSVQCCIGESVHRHTQ